jgi:hypothetical protein
MAYAIHFAPWCKIPCIGLLLKISKDSCIKLKFVAANHSISSLLNAPLMQATRTLNAGF